MALEHNAGYACLSDFTENTVAELLVAEGVGHKESAVKAGVVYEVIYADLAYIEGLTANHSPEGSKIRHVDIVLRRVLIYSPYYIVLIFLVQSRDHDDEVVNSFGIHFCLLLHGVVYLILLYHFR